MIDAQTARRLSRENFDKENFFQEVENRICSATSMGMYDITVRSESLEHIFNKDQELFNQIRDTLEEQGFEVVVDQDPRLHPATGLQIKWEAI